MMISRNMKDVTDSVFCLVLVLFVCVFLSPVAFAAPGDIVTIAGGGVGDYGASASAILRAPNSVFRDSHGSLFIADSANHRIRKVDPNGIISTVAGTGAPGFSGDSGPAISANLNYPTAVYVDAFERIYIADTNNHRIRVVDSSGVITTVAGNGIQGYSGDNDLAIYAKLNNPLGVTVDASGMIYIADYGNHRIRRISAYGVINTIAGSGIASYSGDGGPAVSASLNGPIGMTMDSTWNLIIADYNNNRIRKVDLSGVITTIAGNGTASYSGDNGLAVSASINGPCGVSVDFFGNVVFSDQNNNRIRKIDVGGVITTLAGNGSAGYSGDGSPATSSSINHPTGVVIDSNGSIYVADLYNNRIRKVDFGGIISTVAGNGTTGFTGDGGLATSAALLNPSSVVSDSSGNIYISDKSNFRVRKITPDGMITTIAGVGSNGSTGDGGQATSAQLSGPTGLALNPTGDTLYIADPPSNRIRQIYLPNGNIFTLFGDGSAGYYGDGHFAAFGSAINNASGIAVKPGSNMIYFADTGNQRVRSANDNGTGMMLTEIGVGAPGAFGDGGYKTSAWLNNPVAIAFDSAGQLYISDRNNNRIRKVDIYGTVSTYAGNGEAGYAGDGGDAAAARLNSPGGITFDVSGNLYIADTANHRIRKVDTFGVITTVAGNGIAEFAGDGGAATSASLNNPEGVYVDLAGNILVADSNNHRIRKVMFANASTDSITVTITSPTAATQSTTPLLSYTVSEGTVKVKVDGVTVNNVSGDNLYLAAGFHTVRVESRDAVGNQGFSEVRFTVLQPPTVTISSPAAGYTNNNSPVLAYTVSNGTVVVKVDDIVVNKVSGDTLGPLVDGTHWVQVVATNAGGIRMAQQLFTIDTTVPTVSITSPTSGTINTSSRLLSYTVSDGTVVVKLDGVTINKTSGSNLTSLTDGPHIVRVESTDATGNRGFAEVNFTVDLPPTVNISSPAVGLNTNNISTILLYTVSNGTVVVKLDGVVVNKLAGDSLGPLADGTHTVRVEATDTAGTGFAERSFTVDTIAPDILITSPTAGTTTDNQPLLTFTSNSGGMSTVKVDGVVVSKFSGSHLSTLANGAHTVRVELQDLAGNIGVAEVSFFVNAPVLLAEGFETGNLTSIPWITSGNGFWSVKNAVKHGGTYAAEAPVSILDSQSAAMEVSMLCTSANISFWYSVSSEANYDYLTFYVDGVQQGRWSGAVPWTQATYAVTAGTHAFKWVYSKDGSVSSGSDTAWVDDIVFPVSAPVPTVNISSPVTGITNNNRPVLVYSASNGTVVVKVDGLVVNKVSGDTLDQLPDGTHTVRVEATNSGGTGFAETTFTVDTISPVLGINPVVTPTKITNQTITGTRESGVAINVSVNTVAMVGIVEYPTATTWSVPVSALAEGNNTITVTAIDAAINSAQTAATITLDTIAPVVSITFPTAGLSNSRTPVLTYSVSDGTTAVSVDGVVTSKASGDTLGPLADGPHTVRIEATDAAGNTGFAEVSFTVDATSPTITITSPTAGNTNNRTPLLSFAVSEGSAVVTVDGVALPLVSGDNIGQLVDGAHTVRVDTTDAAGNPGFAEVSFTVDTLAPAVTISTPAIGFSNNNRPVLNYTANDGTVVVKVDGLVVGKVSGDTLDSLADGFHVLRVQSTDNAGNTGFVETTFTIDTAAPVVTISSPVPGPTNNRPALAFTVSDGAVAVKVDGATISKISGDILDQLVDGVHTVRVEATDVAGNIGFSEVIFSVESYVVIMNAGANGSISGPSIVNYGGSAAYTITPTVGYHVADVLVDGISVGAVTSYSFSNITTNHTISASFAINSYSIIASVGANGSISGPTTANYGSSAIYTISPVIGYHVSDVLMDGVSAGAVTSYSFSNVTTNHTISASFAINNYSITASAGVNGSISGPTTVNYGSSAIYTISPVIGYHVSDVLVDGVSAGAVTSYNFNNVTANHTISASFAINSYSIIATAGANGSISGPAMVTYGSSAVFIITPSAGYRVVDLLVDGVSVGSVTNYSFNNVTINHTISATFAALADLIANSASGPSSATRGKSISVSSSVKNQGGGSAGSFTVTFYLSKDTAVTNSDTLLGTKTVTSLNAGSTATVSGSFTVPSGMATGRYYVGVIVDSGSAIAESNENNNSKAAGSTTTIR